MPDLKTPAAVDEALSELLVQFLEALDDAPSAHEELVEAFCSSHPDLAPAFRRSVTELAEAGLLDGEPQAEDPEQYGEYRVEERLGSGGMGVVFRARKDGAATSVALKVIRPAELLLGGRARFAREAEAVARLDHPGIAKLLEAQLEGDRPSLAFEIIDGEPLDAILRRLRLAPPGKRSSQELGASGEDATRENDGAAWARAAATVCLQVAKALAHAHAHGVVHRDVKPANIVLGRTGHATLLDFGLATLEGAQRLTRSGAKLGSLPYMPPEQVRGERDSMGPAADVYALGVTLYELITLHQPFIDASAAATRERVLAAMPALPRERVADIPASLEAVCMKAMDGDVRHRYPTAQTFADDLARAIRGEPVAARLPSALRKTSRWAKRHPSKAASFAAAALVAISLPSTVAWAARREANRQGEYNRQLESALKDTLATKKSADDNLVLARSYLLDHVNQTCSDTLAREPELAQARIGVIRKCLTLFRDVYGQLPEEATALRGLSRFLIHRGMALQDYGSADERAASHGDFAQFLGHLERSGQHDRLLHELRPHAHALRMIDLFRDGHFETVIELQAAIECDVVADLAWRQDKRNPLMNRVIAARRAACAAVEIGEYAAAREFEAIVQNAGAAVLLTKREHDNADLAWQVDTILMTSANTCYRVVPVDPAVPLSDEEKRRRIYNAEPGASEPRVELISLTANDPAGALRALERLAQDELRQLEGDPTNPVRRRRAARSFANAARFALDAPAAAPGDDVHAQRALAAASLALELLEDSPSKAGIDWRRSDSLARAARAEALVALGRRGVNRGETGNPSGKDEAAKRDTGR